VTLWPLPPVVEAVTVSCAVDRHVKGQSCRLLEPVTDRYVLMSTVSVYRGSLVEPLSESSKVLYSPPDAGPDFGVDVEDEPIKYGYQKSWCELADVRCGQVQLRPTLAR
jgi:hypothetical protein